MPGPLDVLDPLVGAELRRGVPRAHLLAPQAGVNIRVKKHLQNLSDELQDFKIQKKTQMIDPALLMSTWATSSRLCPTFLVKVLH